MYFATQFTDVLKRKPITLRDKVRSLVLDLLFAKEALIGYKKQLQKPRVQRLYFHHIFEDEEQKFRNLLKRLAKHHTFISHSEAVARITNNEIDKPYISFSSDDGFKNNLKAAEILKIAGVKSEKEFLNGDYKKSLEMTLNALNRIEPGIHKKLISAFES